MVRIFGRVLVLVLGLTLATGCATRYYSTPKPVLVAARAGLLQHTPMNVSIFDGRANPENSDELKEYLVALMKGAYPSAKHREVGFFSKPEPGAVTISIRIDFLAADFSSQLSTAYATQFGTGNSAFAMAGRADWSGAAVISLKVVDGRSGGFDVSETRLEKVVSRPNMYGYSTAAKVLNEAWSQTVGPMLIFIDDELR